MKNMRRGITGIFLGLTAGFLLAGCGASLPEMTQEQEDQIVNYAVALAVKYHARSQSRLVDLSLYEETEDSSPGQTSEPEKPEGSDDQKEGGMDPVKETDTTDISQGTTARSTLEGFYGLEGIRIDYTGAYFCDTYPGESDEEFFFEVEATAGMKILAVSFELHNVSDSAAEIDLLSVSPRIRLILNDGRGIPILTSVLPDDLVTYQGVVDAGETVKLVILAEVEKADAGEIQKLEMTMKSDSASARINLQ